MRPEVPQFLGGSPDTYKLLALALLQATHRQGVALNMQSVVKVQCDAFVHGLLILIMRQAGSMQAVSSGQPEGSVVLKYPNILYILHPKAVVLEGERLGNGARNMF